MRDINNTLKLILLFSLITTTINAQKLTLGVFPYFDATSLAKLHKPLKNHLATTTNTNIRLVSAPDFPIFKSRTNEGKYDIIITAPHLGRLAQKIAGYEWLGFTSNTSHAVFVTHKDNNIHSVEELKNKSIALPPKGAIIHHLALNTLLLNNINAPKDIKLAVHKSHNNAMLSAILKHTDAASFGAPTWRKYNAPDKQNLRMIGKSEDIPGFAILVHPRVSNILKTKLSDGLYSFANTLEGKEYFKNTGLKNIRKHTNKDFELLDKYLNLMIKSK